MRLTSKQYKKISGVDFVIIDPNHPFYRWLGYVHRGMFIGTTVLSFDELQKYR